MDALLSAVLLLALMGAVMVAFRCWIRRPHGVGLEDPPGLRTVVAFQGTAAEFFQDDDPQGMFVGQRLFAALCESLTAAGIEVPKRGHEEFAHRADCLVEGEPLALILEWAEGQWVASVEWVPRSRAEARHMAWTHHVFAPPDTPALRRLLSALDGWLKAHPCLSGIRWHRKERWVFEDTSQPADSPFVPG